MSLRVVTPTAALAAAGAGVQITSASSLPSSVPVNQQFNFSVTGQVVNGNVTNPAVGLYYYSGPSDYIIIVTQSGTIQLSKGTAVVAYIQGTEPPGTTVSLQAGAILPTPGTYTLQLVAGYISDGGMTVTDYRTYTVNATATGVAPPPGVTAPGLPSWAPLAIVIGIIGVGAIAVAGWMYQQQQMLAQALARR